MYQQERKRIKTTSEPDRYTVKVMTDNGLETVCENAILIKFDDNDYSFLEINERYRAVIFNSLDEVFLKFLLDNYLLLNYENYDFESRCRILFKKCWNFLTQNSKTADFYVRYYFSSSFTKYSYDDHMKRYAVLYEKMESFFGKTVDLKGLLHNIFGIILVRAKEQIHNPDNDMAAAECFRLIYGIIISGIKSEKQQYKGA